MNVEALFAAALALPSQERAAFLDQACAGQPELRAAVEALLAAHEAASRTVPNAPAAPPEATGDYTPEPAEAPRPGPSELRTSDYQPLAEAGAVIAGRYTLQEKIGEGGMGEVWVAMQSEPVKRRVALKLIKAGMDTRAVLQRFDAERQALALMDHPNIARVFDGGMTADRRPFFVMELVNGLGLTRFCDNAKLGIRGRLELFVAICQAVQHAHQKGIIHRDLKPSNILVTLVDARPVPKVIDFGVAKAVGGRLTDEALATEFGAVVGTLEYMAPEQAGVSGIGSDIDTRADIYSLGVILYELLTGLRPLDALRLRKAAYTEMIRIIQEEEPSKPSTRLSTDESLPSRAAQRQTEPRKLMALLRGELDWVVMKCLEKQRDRRYETANGLARDIQHYLADEPVEARPPSAGYRLRKFLARHRRSALAAAVVLLALVGSVAVSSTAAVMIWQEQQQTEAARKNAAENADAAVAVVRDLSSYVDKVEFSGRQTDVTDAQRKSMIDVSLASYERLLDLQPDSADVRMNVARMYRYRANLCRLLNETAEAEKSYREALRHYGILADRFPDEVKFRQQVAETSRDFGLLVKRVGRLKEASLLLDESISVYQKLLLSKPGDAGYQRVLANILIDRSEYDYSLGRFAEAERTARTSAGYYAKLMETPGSHPELLDPLFRGMAENRLALALRELGRLDEAMTTHDDAVSRLATLVKVNPTRDYMNFDYRYRAERAWTMSRAPNRREAAVADMDNAILGWEKLAKQFPQTPLYTYWQGRGAFWRGRVKMLLGQRAAAAQDLAAAVKILDGLVAKYPDMLDYRFDLGLTYTAQGELAANADEAAPFYRQARTMLEETVKRNADNVQYRQGLEELDALTKAKR